MAGEEVIRKMNRWPTGLKLSWCFQFLFATPAFYYSNLKPKRKSFWGYFQFFSLFIGGLFFFEQKIRQIFWSFSSGFNEAAYFGNDANISQLWQLCALSIDTKRRDYGYHYY